MKFNLERVEADLPRDPNVIACRYWLPELEGAGIAVLKPLGPEAKFTLRDYVWRVGSNARF
jgi:hypothetical protein